MLLFWGPSLTQIYNDASVPLISLIGRHPEGLGIDAQVCWGESWPTIASDLARVLDRGVPQARLEVEITTRQGAGPGRARWILGCDIILDDRGEAGGILATAQEVIDLEDLSHAREEPPDPQEQSPIGDAGTPAALENKERLLTIAGRLAGLGGWVYHIRYGIKWSEQVCAVHNVPGDYQPNPDEALTFYIAEHRPIIAQAFARCLNEGEPFDLELQIVPRGLPPRWVRAIGEAVHDEGGSVVGVQGAFHDIQRQKEVEHSLRESEQRFDAMAQAMPIVLWTATPNGEIDYQNSAILEFAGVEPHQLYGEGWLSVIHPDDRERAQQVWVHSITTGEPYEIEYRIRSSGGKYRWFLSRAVPTRDETGRITRWYGSSIDIQDQRTLREEARRMADRLTLTLESITDAFVTLDQEWRFTFLNSEAERLLQRGAEDLIGEVIWDLFPSLVETTFHHGLLHAASARETAEFRFLDEGLSRWVDVRAFPSQQGLAIYFRDITHHVLKERRLQEQAELLERAQDAILVLDLDLRIEFWNRSAQRIYGWERHEILGEELTSALRIDPEIIEQVVATLKSEGEWSGELEQVRKDGEPLFVEGRWSVVQDEDERPQRILAVNTDITDRKALLKQFLRAQRMESIGTLAGGIAHDLNNVLAPILLSVAMLRSRIDDPEIEEALTIIDTSTRRGAEMIKQVLSFARGYEPRDGTVALRRIVNDISRILRETFPKNLRFTVDCPETCWPIIGDATQIHQALMNLLVNARDAMGAGGELQLTTENVVIDKHYSAMSTGASPGPFVKISVIDTGCGIPERFLPQIFDPFFTTKGVGEGTGLGLSTVAAIVRSHGGFVNVYSETDRGTTFRVYLPALISTSTDEVPSEDSSLIMGNGELILVIDDENSVRDIVRQTLEGFGYRVILASDGAEGVAEFAQHSAEIAVVITDMLMPIMDGPSTVRALRRMDPKVKIIGASGLASNVAVARTSEAGLIKFLPKPYTAETLLKMLRELIDET